MNLNMGTQSSVTHNSPKENNPNIRQLRSGLSTQWKKVWS